MGSALDSGSRGPGSSPGRVICVVFLDKTLYSHSSSLYPRKHDEMLGVTCDGLASHSGGLAILLVTSCYRNRDKLM